MFLKQYMVTQQGVVGVILSVTACLKTNTDFSRSLSLSLSTFAMATSLIETN